MYVSYFTRRPVSTGFDFVTLAAVMPQMSVRLRDWEISFRFSDVAKTVAVEPALKCKKRVMLSIQMYHINALHIRESSLNPLI
jgi:hypothetical protein